jgi:superfamily II DNA/RNA helicase
MNNETIEEYEIRQAKINKLHLIIGNMQCLLNSIDNSDICPFCRSKIDVNALKKEYNKRKKEVNKLDSDIQYLNIED